MLPIGTHSRTLSSVTRPQPGRPTPAPLGSFDKHHPFAAGADLARAAPLEAFACAAPHLLEHFKIVPTLEKLLSPIMPGRQLAALAPFYAFPELVEMSLNQDYDNAEKAKNLLDGIRVAACGTRRDGGLSLEHLGAADKSTLFDRIREVDPETVNNLGRLAWQSGIGNCEELCLATGLLLKAQGYPHPLSLVALSTRPLQDGSTPDHCLLSSAMDGVNYFFDPLMHLLKHSASYDFPTPALNFRSMYAAPDLDMELRFTSYAASGQLALCNILDLQEHRRANPLKLAGVFENGPHGPCYRLPPQE